MRALAGAPSWLSTGTTLCHAGRCGPPVRRARRALPPVIGRDAALGGTGQRTPASLIAIPHSRAGKSGHRPTDRWCHCMPATPHGTLTRVPPGRHAHASNGFARWWVWPGIPIVDWLTLDEPRSTSSRCSRRRCPGASSQNRPKSVAHGRGSGPIKKGRSGHCTNQPLRAWHFVQSL